MNSKEFMEKALRSENQDTTSIKKRCSNSHRLTHACFGLSTESGELIDSVKRHVFYGTELDKKNILEEGGDILWYLAIICDELGVNFETLMQKNLDKLEARYNNKFCKEKAINRDLQKELEVLK